MNKYKATIYKQTFTGGEFEKKTVTEDKVMDWSCTKRTGGTTLQDGPRGLSIKGVIKVMGYKTHKVKKGMILIFRDERYTITGINNQHPNYTELECEVM